MIRPRTTGIPGTAVRRVLGAPLLALPCCSAPRPLWQSLPASVVTRVWIAALIVLISLGASSAHAAASNTESDAAAFLRAFSDRAIAMLSDDAVSQEQRSGEFRSLLQSGFDMVPIGRTVLGRHWRTATARQRAEFLQLFEDFVVLAYGSRMSAYSGETLQIGSAGLHGDKDALVRSRVLSSERPPVTVHWRLRRSGEGWRIVDVIVEGVSMTITHRSEFAAVISNNRGGIEGLLQLLPKKTSAADLKVCCRTGSGARCSASERLLEVLDRMNHDQTYLAPDDLPIRGLDHETESAMCALRAPLAEVPGA